MEEGHKHCVIIAETEQEPAEISHSSQCVQSSGETRKISGYEFSHLLIELAVGSQCVLCA